MAGRRAATRRARRHISFEDMAARRAERLVNLVICLLSTRQFLTAERIRDAVPGYEPADGDPSDRRGVQADVRTRQGRAA